MFPQVEVIKGNKLINRINQELLQLRVAPYCRVSTDAEDQLKSFQNQIKYYKQKVKEKNDWVLVKIYSDEAVTGTRDDKRSGFLQMIQDCQNGLIDMVITKSIARFARNTVDTLRYVRLLKEIGVAVYFEEENINTMTMDGELLLTILSSVAQQEVENTSANTKKGLKMKMKRGELVGNNKVLGYDYDKDTKTLSINEDETKIVKYIFKRYLDGVGAFTIARELSELNYLTPKGLSTWSNSTVLGIIKNEKYKGDILQGKSFTVDPISKRRLDNFGEEDMFYVKNNHKGIISDEAWEKANAILKSRSRPRYNKDGVREKQTKKYAFSSLCECGYCGSKLYRRSWNGGTKYNKPVWLCSKVIKNGKVSCPNCKSIPETILEGSFLKSYNLMCTEKEGVFEEFITRLEDMIDDNNVESNIKKLKGKHSSLTAKRSKLTDMMLDNILDKEEFKIKYEKFNQEILEIENNLFELEDISISEKDRKNRLDKFKKILEEQNEINIFNRDVLETTIKKIIVGGFDENQNADPYKITFIYNTGDTNKISTSLEEQGNPLCSSCTDNACSLCITNIKNNYIEILSFQYFERFSVLNRKADKGLIKMIDNVINVSVMIELGLVNMKNH